MATGWFYCMVKSFLSVLYPKFVLFFMVDSSVIFIEHSTKAKFAFCLTMTLFSKLYKVDENVKCNGDIIYDAILYMMRYYK